MKTCENQSRVFFTLQSSTPQELTAVADTHTEHNHLPHVHVHSCTCRSTVLIYTVLPIYTRMPILNRRTVLHLQLYLYQNLSIRTLSEPRPRTVIWYIGQFCLRIFRSKRRIISITTTTTTTATNTNTIIAYLQMSYVFVNNVNCNLYTGIHLMWILLMEMLNEV